MKLNVGSGAPGNRYRHAGWVCLDFNPGYRPHVVGNAFQMPFSDDTFDEVHSIHVLEHLARDKWPIMLQEIYRVTAVDGVVYVEVPDFPEQCKAYLRHLHYGDRHKSHLMRTAIWGKTERMGMGHQFGFDRELLRHGLECTGFDEITFLSPKNAVSAHWRQGPVLLARAYKRGRLSLYDFRTMPFKQLREKIIQ